MSPLPKHSDIENTEAKWRAALVRAEHLRQEYSQQQTANTAESDLEALWLQLWSAERRRDELYRAID